MLVHYLMLGLALGATDDEIRGRYLELTRRHPPGRDPERFRRIAAAYEALADERSRMETALFGSADIHDAEAALQELVAAATRPRSPGLLELLAAEGLAAEGLVDG